MIEQNKVDAYQFADYWVDVGTVDAYLNTSLELCEPDSPLNLWDPNFVIRTRSQERPPVKTSVQGQVVRSLVSNGCTIHGRVEHSVLSPGVYVSPGAIVRDSVIMNDTWIGPGAVVDTTVIDKKVVVGSGVQLGGGDDNTPNAEMPDRLSGGISIVGKGAHLPANIRVGRNVLVQADVDANAVEGYEVIPSGSTINRDGVLLPPPSAEPDPPPEVSEVNPIETEGNEEESA